MKALRHFQAASAQDREFFHDLATSFDAYLHDRYPEVTAIQYGRAFRRLFKVHGKAPHEIASVNYVEAVRNLKMPVFYAAATRAFCRFRGVVGEEVTERRACANKEA